MCILRAHEEGRGRGGHVETEREDFKDNNEENQARMEASDETSKKGCCQVES